MSYVVVATEKAGRRRYSVGHSTQPASYFLALLPNCCTLNYRYKRDADSLRDRLSGDTSIFFPEVDSQARTNLFEFTVEKESK